MWILAINTGGPKRERVQSEPVRLAIIAAVFGQKPDVFPLGSFLRRMPYVRDVVFPFHIRLLFAR